MYRILFEISLNKMGEGYRKIRDLRSRLDDLHQQGYEYENLPGSKNFYINPIEPKINR